MLQPNLPNLKPGDLVAGRFRVVEMVGNRGVRVEVMAFGNSTSQDLRETADRYIDIAAFQHPDGAACVLSYKRCLPTPVLYPVRIQQHFREHMRSTSRLVDGDPLAL